MGKKPKMTFESYISSIEESLDKHKHIFTYNRVIKDQTARFSDGSKFEDIEMQYFSYHFYIEVTQNLRSYRTKIFSYGYSKVYLGMDKLDLVKLHIELIATNAKK